MGATAVVIFAGAICALESVPEGVRASGCTGQGPSWAIAAPAAENVTRGTAAARRAVAERHRGTDSGPCGFDVRDLLLRDDTLWVATDLGVSRLRLSREDWDEWTHYALAADRSGLEETACASVLAEVAEAAAAPGGEELGRRLAEFRPRFWKRHRKLTAVGRRGGTPPASPTARRRNEQALGNAGEPGTGRGADVHPRPRRRPQASQDGG